MLRPDPETPHTGVDLQVDPGASSRGLRGFGVRLHVGAVAEREGAVHVYRLPQSLTRGRGQHEDVGGDARVAQRARLLDPRHGDHACAGAMEDGRALDEAAAVCVRLHDGAHRGPGVLTDRVEVGLERAPRDLHP